MKKQISAFSVLLDRKLLPAFFGFILLAGGGPIAMRVSFLELDPSWMGFIRFGLGAIVFWLLVLYKGLRVSGGRALMGSALHGFFGFGISFVLLFWGLVKKNPRQFSSRFISVITSPDNCSLSDTKD